MLVPDWIDEELACEAALLDALFVSMLVSCKSFFVCLKASVKIGATREVGHSSPEKSNYNLPLTKRVELTLLAGMGQLSRYRGKEFVVGYAQKVNL